MDDDPQLQMPDFKWVYSPRLKPLWLAALQRPDTELQRLAADTVALAHRQGMPELKTVTADLVQILNKPETASTVRRAAAHALVALEAKEQAPALLESAKKYGLDLQIVVEPALADWKSELLRDEWRRRLEDPQTHPRLLELAIEGLGKLADEESQPALLSLVLNKHAPNAKRFAAATALAAIGKGGMTDAARGLLADASPTGIPDRLLGVQLLSADKTADSLTALCELAGDPEPAVAGAALNRVYDVEPLRLFPLAPQAIKSTDANVRRAGIKALLTQGTVEAINTVAPLLDDPIPALRRQVAKGLFDLAQKPDLRPRINAIIEYGLNSKSWRVLEQSALLAGHLNHQPTATKLIELLKHPRPEVGVSTAWALRVMKISETYPAILAHGNYQYERHVNLQTPMHLRPAIYAQLTQIFQLFGEVKYAEADTLMRQFVPKMVGLDECRPAACWALGKIHEGKAPPELAEQFAERIADISSMPPEIETVRYMCAVGLGRMKAESQLPALRRFAMEGSRVSLACYWSIEALTGEKQPETVPREFQVLGWFLQPHDEKQ